MPTQAPLTSIDSLAFKDFLGSVVRLTPAQLQEVKPPPDERGDLQRAQTTLYTVARQKKMTAMYNEAGRDGFNCAARIVGSNEQTITCAVRDAARAVFFREHLPSDVFEILTRRFAPYIALG
jgi:hypothetical protein